MAGRCARGVHCSRYRPDHHTEKRARCAAEAVNTKVRNSANALLLFLLVHASIVALSAQQSAAAAAFREGAAAQQRGDLQSAADAYRRAIEIEPRFAEAHTNLGAVLARLGRYEDAVVSIERAL